MSNTDRIPTAAECAAKIEAYAKHMKDNDPRKTYRVSYFVNGQPMSEQIMAMSETMACEAVCYQCGLLGWSPTKMTAILV